MTSHRKRSSGRLFGIELVQILASLALLIIALSFWAANGSDLASALLRLTIFLYAPLRVAWSLIRWSVETYEITPAILTVRTGVLRRRERRLPWDSIVAIDEQAGLAFRLLDIRGLRLIQSDTAGGAVAVRAVSPAAASELLSFLRQHNPPPVTTASPRDTGEVYRATWSELALMSIVNGRFFLLAPPLVFGAWGVLEDLGVSIWAVSLLAALPPALIVCLSILGFLLIGTLATISRYQGFTARITSARTLVLSYGFVEKRERRIELSAIDGITIRRSLVEQLLRRSRLAVLTIQGTDSVGASVVLPSLPDPLVRRLARVYFRDLVQESAVLPDRPAPASRQAVRSLVILALPAILVMALQDAGLHIVVSAALGAVALGAITALGRALVGRMVMTAADIVKFNRHLVSEVETFVRARACHVVGSAHLRASERPLFFSIHLYAGGPRHMVGTLCSAESLAHVRHTLSQHEESVAQRQRTYSHPTTGGL